MEEAKLPPLPEGLVLTGGAQVLYVGGRPKDTRSAFTADQMRAYGAECARLERERCATLCDSIYAEEQDEPECYGFAKECADAIRGARPMTHTPPKS